MKLDFLFQGRAVGYFEDLIEYPPSPGKYRYEPYRSFGSYQLGEQCRRDGNAICSFRTETGDVEIRVRLDIDPKIIHIDELRTGAQAGPDAT
jgi:hypothetical protein